MWKGEAKPGHASTKRSHVTLIALSVVGWGEQVRVMTAAEPPGVRR